MMYLLKSKDKTSQPAVPPDVHSPPFYIPVKSIAHRYTLLQELGNGSFGSVTLAKLHANSPNSHRPAYHNTLMEDSAVAHPEQENFYNRKRGLLAIKTMMTRLPKLGDYTRVREIKFILAMPAHKNLVRIWELFVDDLNYQLHIVMECMDQNLYQLMRQRKRRAFSLPSLKSILAQILAGIRHIHAHNFFHRDIKPENILISPSNHYYSKEWLLDGHYRDNYIVKIADYGLARHVRNKATYTAYVSTRWYRSPEILLRQGHYSRPIDVWAFGCVVAELATFKPLFPGSDEMDQIWKILEVLGTPHSMPEAALKGYTPNGGVWEHSKQLALRMKLKFPYVEGVDVDYIINNPQLSDLSHVVKACLTWDPKLRASVQELCDMPYFHNTIVATKNTIVTSQQQQLHSLKFFENDENIAKLDTTKGCEVPSLKLETTHSTSTSLAPNIIDFNGTNPPHRDEELSFRQFLYDAGTARKSDSLKQEFSSNFEVPKLSTTFDADQPDMNCLHVEDVAEDEDEEDEEEEEEEPDDFSSAEYYVASSVNYGAIQDVSEKDIANYIPYPTAENEGHHSHYCADGDPIHRCHIQDDMSIDSCRSNGIPRTFTIPTFTQDSGANAQDHHSHSFTQANSLTF